MYASVYFASATLVGFSFRIKLFDKKGSEGIDQFCYRFSDTQNIKENKVQLKA